MKKENSNITVDQEEKQDMVPLTSIDNENKPQLVPIESNVSHGRSSTKDIGDFTKYEPSTGPLDGCYSYISWIQMIMVQYLNFYLSSEQPQLRMMYQRTGLQLFWLFFIGLHGVIPVLHENGSFWQTKYHQYIPFATNVPILIMYGLSVLFTIITMMFFWLLMKMEMINAVKKKELVKFKSIYDAIFYGRFDAILNQFDKPKFLTMASRLKDGKTPLYYAAELKQTEIAEWLISKDCVDINSGANQNRTPLYIAARIGAYEIVKMLLDRSECKVNEANSLGRTPLYAACREGRYDIVVELLKQPLIDVNSLTKHKSCALAAACQHGHIRIVEELLKKPEIDINNLNESNYTPIFIAALGTFICIFFSCC